MWCVYFRIGGFIVQDPPNVVHLCQQRWVHCTGPSSCGASVSAQVGSLYRTLLIWCVYFSIGGFIVQDPPYVVRLFQHRWVHLCRTLLMYASIFFSIWWVLCAGPFSCGASISAQVGSLCRTLLMWCVYFSIGGFIVQDLLMWCVYFSIGGFIVQDPPQVVRLFQHRWVHCTRPSSCGGSISAQVGSLYRTLLLWCVYFSIGGSNYSMNCETLCITLQYCRLTALIVYKCIFSVTE